MIMQHAFTLRSLVCCTPIQCKGDFFVQVHRIDILLSRFDRIAMSLLRLHISNFVLTASSSCGCGQSTSYAGKTCWPTRTENGCM